MINIKCGVHNSIMFKSWIWSSDVHLFAKLFWLYVEYWSTMSRLWWNVQCSGSMGPIVSWVFLCMRQRCAYVCTYPGAPKWNNNLKKVRMSLTPHHTITCKILFKWTEQRLGKINIGMSLVITRTKQKSHGIDIWLAKWVCLRIGRRMATKIFVC